MKKSKKAIVLQSSPYLVWSILFIIVPLFMVLYYGLTDAEGNFTLANIAAIAQPEQAKAFGLALALALAATAICFLLAYPLAMILARGRAGEKEPQGAPARKWKGHGLPAARPEIAPVGRCEE